MASRASRVITLVVVLLTVVSAAVLGRLWLTGTTATATEPVATMAGVTVEVRGTVWALMDHVEDGQGGFLMPDEMMPGAPTGNRVRLGVGLTLINTRSQVHEFSLVDEFTMTGGREPEPLALSADTVGKLGRLGPGSALNATLYFDVEAPADDELPPLYLRWTRDRDTVLIPVPLPGAPPAHDH
jgi:hypothetical protein